MSQSTRPIAMVTGASSGIGDAFARQLAAEGHDLIVVARRVERLDDLARRLTSEHGVAVEVLPADLTQDGDVDRLAQRIAGETRLELLINNAGFGNLGRFAELDVDGEVRIVRLNVVAPMRLTHAALLAMIERGRGGIINVASISGFIPQPFTSTYCGTKALLINWSEAVYQEAKPHGVTVQVLCPGFTRTELFTTGGVDPKKLFPDFAWMSADSVARISLRALRRRKALCIPGLRNRMLGLLLRLTPRSLHRILAADMFGRGDKLLPDEK